MDPLTLATSRENTLQNNKFHALNDLKKCHVFKIAERIGLLLTIGLISTTIYVTVDAPPSRGMSYIETWILGTMIPTLTAILESCFVLLKLRKRNSVDSENIDKTSSTIMYADKVTALCLLTYLFIFQISYWAVSCTL